MTDEQREEAIRRTNEAIGRMCSAFAATVRDRAKYKQHFQMIAEQSAEMIFRLRKEIDDLIGLTDYVTEFGVPPTNEELDAMAAAGASHPGGNGTPLQPQPGESAAIR